MYDISHEQRGESYTLLKAAAISGLWKDDHEAATLIIASVVALCFRDVSTRTSSDEYLGRAEYISACRVIKIGNSYWMLV